MTDIIKAIKALDANAQVVVNGEPSNQAEYESQVKYISGANENGSAIYKDTQDFTWSEVSAKKAELQTDYDNKQYQRDRANAYPSIQDQLDMQYHDAVDGTTTWKDAIATVKTDIPKT
ncbi:hypothetical protein [uncultured Mediterranean phage uvMED]|nr:hypothetical protein [uncultured Mediterranean phage uvMED]